MSGWKRMRRAGTWTGTDKKETGKTKTEGGLRRDSENMTISGKKRAAVVGWSIRQGDWGAERKEKGPEWRDDTESVMMRLKEEGLGEGENYSGEHPGYTGKRSEESVYSTVSTGQRILPFHHFQNITIQTTLLLWSIQSRETRPNFPDRFYFRLNAFDHNWVSTQPCYSLNGMSERNGNRKVIQSHDHFSPNAISEYHYYCLHQSWNNIIIYEDKQCSTVQRGLQWSHHLVLHPFLFGTQWKAQRK